MRINSVFYFFTLCFGVGVEALPAPPIESVQTRKEACRTLESNLVSYVDLIFYVEKCELRPIKNIDIFNSILISHQEKMTPLDEKSYALIPIGKEYGYEDYASEFGPLSQPQRCEKYNNRIMTADNINYYFIEDCKKRKILNASDIDRISKNILPLYFVSIVQLKWFPDGKEMTMGTDTILKKSSYEEAVLVNLPDKKTLCAPLEKSIVAFYEGFFYVEKCTLRPLSSLPIELQKKAERQGDGIKELTLVQRLGIPVGTEISAEEVQKKF